MLVMKIQITQKQFVILLPWKTRLKITGKNKAIPLQPWTGPEGSRKLRLPDFMTFGT